MLLSTGKSFSKSPHVNLFLVNICFFSFREPTPDGPSDEYPAWPPYTVDEPLYYKYSSSPTVGRQYEDSFTMGMW